MSLTPVPSSGATGHAQKLGKIAILGQPPKSPLGYMKDFPVERMMRDAKLIQIYTGTNQIMRVVAGREILKK